MRPTEQSGDEAKRFRAPDGVVRGSWLHRTVVGVLEGLLTRLTGRDATSGYAALIETLPFGVSCWGPDARLIASNSRFAERLRVDVLPSGAAYHEVVKTLAQGGYMQSVREDLENRLLELHREDGSTLLIEERPLDGSGFVTLVMDVTESRRTNQLLTTVREEQRLLARRYHEEKLRAEAASRSKTSFLAHLSHDIRTPLNHIIGFADMMRQQPFGPLGDAKYLSYVEAVKSSGERLLGFFGSILELAELEGGRRELRRDRFTADELLLSVFRRYTGQAQAAGVIFGLGGPCNALLSADRFALERMVSNLVENAVRFTPRGGKVTLAAYAGADGVVLEITDTGIGMSAERLATLSQPFVFGDAALTRDREGAGLGIAISRAIAELSGGHLAIDSRQGLGTTVAVSLPIMPQEEAKAA
ncbi:PAS domain-containing sensor histidine kinase [Devosia sp.]|uniref:sensor histidine kinase n=1 Tax=Devosia sp. TaxID=1871048 RepID=UPI001AC06DB6|nr:PAS domain-containing sensor histidine kinase [Devosia sp.]MBN9310891.1 PAS-domain containing protein [Devosia sp.]